uniref:Uncharacterized protein n=1 Tax=Anopheles atroparvus TaxID=41427 RepID=A0A182IPR0_ANOAO
MSLDRHSAVQDERVEQREALSTPATGSAAGRSSVPATNATVTSPDPAFAAAQQSGERTSSQREQGNHHPSADAWAANESPPGSMQDPSAGGARRATRSGEEEARALRMELEESKLTTRRLEQKTLEAEERECSG